jgi:amino acid adenylation domain-containing protein
MTYAELVARSLRMADRLQARGVDSGCPVGVLLDRTPELIVSILAIWQLGAVYVPLDPSYPNERLGYCAADAGIDLLVTSSALVGRAPTAALGIVLADRPADAEDVGGGHRLERPPYADAAYVIYTSGTTGKPKGVVGTHIGIINSIREQQRQFPFANDDVACHKAPIGFIDAIFEVFVPLTGGTPLVLAPASQVRDPIKFLALIDAHRVTRLMLVPSAARALLKVTDFAARSRCLRWVTLNSEPVDRELVKALAAAVPSCRFIHAYGATETGGDMCFNEIVARPEVGPITVGAPLDNMRLVILDEKGGVAAPGSPGEIYAGGIGIAEGYLHQPHLTAAQFIADPSSRAAGHRLYRTGDIGRGLPSGECELLGRRDRQVKIAGFRVELGEVEAAIRRIRGVEDVAVIARKSGARSRLFAYAVGASGAEVDPLSMRRELLNLLPRFAVPSRIWLVPKLPLSPNGKIDFAALAGGAPGRAGSETSKRPGDATQSRLAEIFADALGVERVAVDDEFFDLGGDSLAAAGVVAEIQRLFGLDVPLSAVFEAATARGLARRVQTMERSRTVRATAGPASSDGAPAPLSPLQQMFWNLDHVTLPEDANTFCLAADLRGPLNIEALESALSSVVDRHSMLRCRFVARGGRILQVADSGLPVRLNHLDLSSRPPAVRRREMIETVRDIATRGMDLVHGPPMRADLVRLGARRHVLAVTLHHLIADDLSLEIIEGDLARAYSGAPDGAPMTLSRELPEYAQVARWRAKRLDRKFLAAQLDYWRRRLDRAVPVELRTDSPRRAQRNYQGASTRIDLSNTLARGLKRIGRQHGATTFMTVAASVATLLAIAARQSDILLRIDFSDRRQGATKGMVGLFVNFLPLRIEIAETLNFAGILERTRSSVLEAVDHPDIAYDRLIDALAPRLGANAAALDRIVFAMQRRPLPRDWLAGLTAEEIEVEAPNFHIDSDLEFYWTDTSDGLRGKLDYSRDLFNPTLIAHMLGCYRRLVAALVADPLTPLARIRPLVAP